METVGDRIRKLREKAKWSQGKLGKLVEVKGSTIGLWERGDRGVSISYLEEINEAFRPLFGDNLFWLVTGNQPEKYLNAFEISNKFIAKDEVLEKTENWLIEMDSLREIRVAGKMSEILEAFSVHVLGGSQASGTNGSADVNHG